MAEVPRRVEYACPELLSLNTRVARKAHADDGERCLLEGADSLFRTMSTTCDQRDRLDGVVNCFMDNDLRLLQSDKEAGFLAMTGRTFPERERRWLYWIFSGLREPRAINKNFLLNNVSAAKVKSEAVALCKRLEL